MKPLFQQSSMLKVALKNKLR